MSRNFRRAIAERVMSAFGLRVTQPKGRAIANEAAARAHANGCSPTPRFESSPDRCRVPRRGRKSESPAYRK